jgi:hypothetical protein
MGEMCKKVCFTCSHTRWGLSQAGSEQVGLI